MKKTLHKPGYLVLISFLLLTIPAGYAQTLSVSGNVVNQRNEPLPGATVTLVEKNQTQAAGELGRFTFTGLEPGTYRFTAFLIGHETGSLELTLSESDTTLLITLREKENQLQGVEIIGRKEQGYKNTQSFAGTKTETPARYVPQAISYVTKEVIADQMAFKSSDIVKNISGVNQFSYYDNDLSLRGFRAGGALINGLRNATTGWNQSLLPYVERMEVIKGPASALFANTDPGGTVNIVTKKPLDESRKAIGFATGSYNTFRATADFTGPMNESGTLLYRLNLAYQNAESFRVLQGGEDLVLAPSVSFIPDEKTRVNFDLVYSKSKGKLDRGQPIFGATAGTELYSTPVSFAIGKENDYLKELNLFATASLQREISEQVSFHASYMKIMYNEDLLERRTSNSYAVDADSVVIPTLMQMRTYRRMRKNYTDNITLYLVSGFKTGPLEHKLLTGYDYITYQQPVGSSSYNAFGYRDADNSGIINTYDTEHRDQYLIENNMPVPNVPHFDLENPDYSITEISEYINLPQPLAPAKYYVNGIYVQDQIKWDQWQMLLGLRQEFYTDILNYEQENSERVEQKALLPRIGLVYTPADQVSLYGTYTEGYQPQSAGTIGSPEIYGGPFDPLSSRMIEAGAKAEFFNRGLAVNLAVYHIEQNNILVDAGDAANHDMLRQIGQERSRGVELDVYGQVMPGLNVTANFAYNRAEITESDNPEEIGQLLPNAPQAQAGLWAKYTFSHLVLKGLGIGLGGNYVSKRTTFSDILELPAYTVVNGALYYTVDKFKLSATVNNVFDKTHWVGGYSFHRLYPGRPRNFLVGVDYTF